MSHALSRRGALLGLAAGAAALGATRPAAAKDIVRIGAADQDLLPDHHLRDRVAPKAVRQGGHRGRADDLSRRRREPSRRWRPAPPTSRSTPPPWSAAGRRRASGMKIVATAVDRLLRLVPGGEDRLADHQGRPSSPARRSASPRPAPAPTSSRCGPCEHRKIAVHRACRSAAAAWCPTCSRGNVDAMVLYSPLSFKMMQAEEARSADRLRRRGADAYRRRLGRDRQVIDREAGGGAEGAERAVRRAALAAQQQATPRSQADRRDRRDQPAHRRARSRQPS